MNDLKSPLPIFALRPYRTLTQRENYGDYKIHKTSRLPQFLSETPYWQKPSTTQHFEDVSVYQGLHRSPLTIPGKDITGPEVWMERDLGYDILGQNQILGIESGIRSTIVKSNDGKLFRLKGTRFGPPYIGIGNPVDYILGGQSQLRSEKERNGMDQIYSLFEEQGSPTPVHFAGQYEFNLSDAEIYENHEDSRKGTNSTNGPLRIVTDIFEILGDTRCDELLGLLDVELRFGEQKGNSLNSQEVRELKQFYKTCGEVVGQQVQLLHNAGLVWNEGAEFVNDYLGNKVFYLHKGKLRLGLLDFDNCVFPKTKTSAEIECLQDLELEEILKQAHNGITSVEPFKYYYESPSINTNLQANKELRDIYAKGILRGYSSSLRSVTNEIDADLEKIIFAIHRITETDTNSYSFMDPILTNEGVLRGYCYYS